MKHKEDDKWVKNPPLKMQSLKAPIGDIILKAVKDDVIQQVHGPYGICYHYDDVCKLLSNLQSRIEELEAENDFLKQQINDLMEQRKDKTPF